MCTVRLVGVSVEELRVALEYSGLIVKEVGKKVEVHQIPAFIRTKDKPHTTLELWEKLGEHQERMEKIKSALEEWRDGIKSVLGEDDL